MKPIRFTAHAAEQCVERGASHAEVGEAIRTGTKEPAKRGRFLYRANFQYNAKWQGVFYRIKQVVPVVAEEETEFVVITALDLTSERDKTSTSGRRELQSTQGSECMSKRPRTSGSTLDFLVPLYEARHSRSSLLEASDGVLSSAKVTARLLPFYATGSVPGWLEAINSPVLRVLRLREGDGVTLFELRERGPLTGGDPDGQIGHFFLYEHPAYPGVSIFIVLDSPWLFDRLRRLIDRAFPTAFTTFITHAHFQRLIEGFQARYELSQVTITSASFRLRLQSERRAAGGRKQISPFIGWPQMEIATAFNWLAEQNGWFQSLAFNVFHDQVRLANIAFARNGTVRTTGLLAQVFQAFVEPVCKTLHENVTFFEGRSRRSRKQLEARPLVIGFEEDQLGESEERRRFVGVMQQFPRASVSVLHGNPYVHLSIMDYYDGSTFDVWVLSPGEVTIVPQLKGSVAAIQRVINYIFDDYAEGRIRNYAAYPSNA